eukprot:Awhi_evm1s10036
MKGFRKKSFGSDYKTKNSKLKSSHSSNSLRRDSTEVKNGNDDQIVETQGLNSEKEKSSPKTKFGTLRKSLRDLKKESEKGKEKDKDNATSVPDTPIESECESGPEEKLRKKSAPSAKTHTLNDDPGKNTFFGQLRRKSLTLINDHSAENTSPTSTTSLNDEKESKGVIIGTLRRLKKINSKNNLKSQSSSELPIKTSATPTSTLSESDLKLDSNSDNPLSNPESNSNLSSCLSSSTVFSDPNACGSQVDEEEDLELKLPAPPPAPTEKEQKQSERKQKKIQKKSSKGLQKDAGENIITTSDTNDEDSAAETSTNNNNQNDSSNITSVNNTVIGSEYHNNKNVLSVGSEYHNTLEGGNQPSPPPTSGLSAAEVLIRATMNKEELASSRQRTTSQPGPQKPFSSTPNSNGSNRPQSTIVTNSKSNKPIKVIGNFSNDEYFNMNLVSTQHHQEENKEVVSDHSKDDKKAIPNDEERENQNENAKDNSDNPEYFNFDKMTFDSFVKNKNVDKDEDKDEDKDKSDNNIDNDSNSQNLILQPPTGEAKRRLSTHSINKDSLAQFSNPIVAPTANNLSKNVVPE